MKARSVRVVALLVVSMVGIPLSLSAQTISTSIGGSPGPSGPSPLPIAGNNYPSGVTITKSNVNGVAPVIEIVNDGGQDYLVMRNAKITTPTPVANYVISFWATMGPLPNVNIPYDTHLLGTYVRSNGVTAASNDEVWLKAWFDNTQIGSTQYKRMGNNPVTLTTSAALGANQNPRTLKHEITMTTTVAGDMLATGAVVGGRVRNTAATDRCDERIPPEKCKDMTKGGTAR